MAYEVAQAYISIIPTTKDFKSNLMNAVSDAGSAGESAGKTFGGKFSGVASVAMGTLISTGITAAISGAKQLGDSVIGLGKQATASYGEYEQLIGGVEKLFGKEAMGQVMENANSAFATAGMSANEYMDTVTSFSASLISGLNGDTEAAARISDVAIRDMADNANTFGTSMESIQYAYQGFAKGNFTMLDNLKLGYGGTKTEMLRLVNESGVLKESVDSLDDVTFDQMIEAIHAVQQNMNITGTTANEAAGTLQGSTGSMAAAWQNMLTGMANENANFGELAANFIDTLITPDGQGGYLGNLIPRIAVVIQGASEAIATTLPALIQAVVPLIEENIPIIIEAVQMAISTILQVLPEIVPVITDLIPQIILALTELMPQIVQAGIQILLALMEGLIGAIPQLIEALPQIIDDVINVIYEWFPDIIDAGIQLLMALTEGILNALPQLIDRLPEIITSIVEALVNAIPQLTEAGVQLFLALVQNLPQIIAGIVKAIPDIMVGIMEAIDNAIPQMMEAGGHLISGLWQGMSERTSWLWDQVSNFLGNLWDGITGFFQIASPSKKMAWVGEMLGEGLAGGMEDSAGLAVDEATNMAQDINAAMGAINTEYAVSASMAGGGTMDNLMTLLNTYLPQLANQQIVLDSGQLVGATAPAMNNELGRIQVRERRR